MSSSAGSDRSVTFSSRMTHYQILGVPQDSSTADIKSAFIALSKSHHPDLNSNDPTKHDVFVRIMQAYTVLSKPELRSTYDSRLHAAQVRHQQRHASGSSNSTLDFDFDPSSSPSDWTVESNAPRWRDQTIWEMRDRSDDKFYEDRPYYGIKGIRRVSNLWIAGGAVMVLCIGAACQFVALRKNSAFVTSRLDAKDVRLGSHLKSARQLAERNGNNVQLEILEAKLASQVDEDSGDMN